MRRSASAREAAPAIARGAQASYGLSSINSNKDKRILNEDDRGETSDAGLERTREGRAEAARNLLLGHWAANLMGLKDGEAYSQAVARGGATGPHDEDVLRKVSRDLADSGLSVSLGEVHAKMEEFLALARAQLEFDDKQPI